MIGSALRLDIERYADEVRRSNPLFTKAADGSLSRERIVAYLANIRFLVSHTPRHSARARDRSRELGHDRLATHYEERRLEESGHDAWAESDLRRLAVDTAPPEVVPSMIDLVRFVGARIDDDPTLYLAYALLAEHLTVIIGPEWLRALEGRCGIPSSAMSVVANHIDLDREHVERALDRIDDLVADPRKLPPLREMLAASIAHFERFCAEVTDETRSQRAALEAPSHVSAA